jgi:hypothetical protein
VIEHAGGARLLLETPEAVRISGQSAGEDLDGNLAPEAGVLGAINLAHAASAERREHFVRAKLCSLI